MNQTLRELFLGVLAWGILCQATVVWFLTEKGSYSLGLWIGIVLAAAASYHMWWSLDRSLDFESETAVKLITRYHILRYAVIVIVLGVVMVSGIANPLSAFLGVMGLKVAAYIQPFTHKLSTKLIRSKRS